MSGDVFTWLLGLLTACSFGLLAQTKTHQGLRLVCRGIYAAVMVSLLLQGTLRLVTHFLPKSPRWAQDLQEVLPGMAFGLMLMIIGGLAVWSTLALRRMPEESIPGQQS